MAIKEVTYYQVACDAPGCSTMTQDLSDYSAWADHGQARDEWSEHGGVVLDDGRAFCDEHAKPHLCAECTEEFQQPLEPGEDGRYCCVDCLAEQPVVSKEDSSHADS